jgi:hypothetical protein
MIWTYQKHTMEVCNTQKKQTEWKVDSEMLLFITNFTNDNEHRKRSSRSSKKYVSFPYRNDKHLQRNGRTNKNDRLGG